MPEFLLEIGVEEIPARFIPLALTQLEELARETLKNCGISPQDYEIHVWGTPRRLALYLSSLPPTTPERMHTLLGPPWERAFNQGAPTPQALGFAQKHRVPVGELQRIETPKGVFAGLVEIRPGIAMEDLLCEAIPKWLRKVHFPKMMRWTKDAFSFARPIRWILPLLEDRLLPLEIPGIPVNRLTLGPRYAPRPVYIPHPREYKKTLKRVGVLVDPFERRKRIQKRTRTLLKGKSLRIVWDDELLTEVTFLTEWPEPALGEFPSRYLKLPEKVIKTVLRDHQRCFVVTRDTGELAPYFLFVMNRRRDPQHTVRQGNERVVTARLEDAWFYYCEDLGIPLDAQESPPQPHRLITMGNALKDMVFLERMGSMADRKVRIRSLAEKFCDILELPPSDEMRETLILASTLNLNDLGSKMVYEYPELAGYMTPIYAMQGQTIGEKTIPSSVIIALKESILPDKDTPQLPQTLPGYLLAIAQRLDTLYAHAALGHYPTGTHDPFGLKSLADEIILLLLEGKPLSETQRNHLGLAIVGELPSTTASSSGSVSCDLKSFWLQLLHIPEQSSVNGKDSPTQKESFSHSLSQLGSFLYDRLEAFFTRRSFPLPWAKGVIETVGFQPREAEKRLLALRKLSETHEFPAFLDTYKRFRNIVREVSPSLHLNDYGEDLEPHERSFLKLLNDCARDLEKILKVDSQRSLDLLQKLVPAAELLFQKVRIEHDDPAIRQRRKSMVAYARSLFLRYMCWDRLLEG